MLHSHSYQEIKPELEFDHRGCAQSLTLVPRACFQKRGQILWVGRVTSVNRTQATFLDPVFIVSHLLYPAHPVLHWIPCNVYIFNKNNYHGFERLLCTRFCPRFSHSYWITTPHPELMISILQMKGLRFIRSVSKYWRYWAQLKSHFLHEAFWIFLTIAERSRLLYASYYLDPLLTLSTLHCFNRYPLSMYFPPGTKWELMARWEKWTWRTT